MNKDIEAALPTIADFMHQVWTFSDEVTGRPFQPIELKVNSEDCWVRIEALGKDGERFCPASYSYPNFAEAWWNLLRWSDEYEDRVPVNEPLWECVRRIWHEDCQAQAACIAFWDSNEDGINSMPLWARKRVRQVMVEQDIPGPWRVGFEEILVNRERWFVKSL